MRKIICILFVFCTFNSFSQNKVEILNEGNSEFNNGDYKKAEQLYRESLEKDASYYKAHVNLAHSLYKQEKFDESTSFYKNSLELTDEKSNKGISHYNLGNSQLIKGKVEESIESYKNSLRIEPNNMNTKRNLAIAQSLLKKPKDEISKEELKQILRALKREEQKVQTERNRHINIPKDDEKRTLLKDW